MNELIPSWCLAVATLLGEAGNEPYLGKLAVAKTIRNRMRLQYSSDGSVAGTVLRPLQFSLWNTGDPGRIRTCQTVLDDKRTREAQLAWFESAARHSELGAAFDKVVLYHADYVSPDWAPKVKLVKKIGRHLFYIDHVWQERYEKRQTLVAVAK